MCLFTLKGFPYFSLNIASIFFWNSEFIDPPDGHQTFAFDIAGNLGQSGLSSLHFR
jgi:hypothetical protein